MKKIASFLLAVVLVCSLMTVTAFALPRTFSGNVTMPSGKYDAFSVLENANVTMNGLVDFDAYGGFDLGRNSTLTIDDGGILTGNDIWFSNEENSKIILKGGGKIELSFLFDSELEAFASLLEAGGIPYKCENGTIKAEMCKEHSFGEDHICTVCGYVCPHKEWVGSVCAVCGIRDCELGMVPHTWEDGRCSVCGYECPHDESENGKCKACGTELEAVGSILSEGNLWIAIVVAVLAVGVVAALVITKKKKPATANGASTEDEE